MEVAAAVAVDWCIRFRQKDKKEEAEVGLVVVVMMSSRL
jgi:hypothetical protein